MQTRYERNLPALSQAESDALHTKKICVVGCGGLGGYVIEMAARMGVGHIVCVDFDRFSESNLNRQLLCEEGNLGEPKALTAQQRVARINSEVTVTAVCEALTEENAARALQGCDAAVDALDNIPARLLLQRRCAELGVPLVHGAIAGWYGQVTTVMPGDDSLTRLYGRHRKAPAGMGNLPFAAAATAAAQCAEVTKLLTGRGELMRGRVLVLDLLKGEWKVMGMG